MNNIIQKQYENQTISFDLTSDVMISLTEMAKANGKRTNDWMSLPSTKSYLSALEKSNAQKYGSEAKQEVIVKNGGNNNGTWASKRVAIRFAQWLSEEFSIWVDMMLGSILSSRIDLQSILQFIKIDVVEQSGFVYYIMEVDTGNVKIGVSKNPESRLKQLQTGNSSRLELIKTEQYQDAHAEEKRLHFANSDKHIQGEWFSPRVVSNNTVN
jgi:hypothetical protein